MKSKIIFLRGLPGSGKSYWAFDFIKNIQNFKRVNKDDLRNSLHGGHYTKSNEKFVLEAQYSIARLALSQGYGIILDNTNFEPKHLEKVQELANEFNVDLEIRDFNAPLEDCIERDKKRTNPVGETIIREMWQKYLQKTPEPVKYVQGLQDAVIIDIDGTLAIKGDRDIYDCSKVYLDTVNPMIQKFIDMVPSNVIIMFVSGRDKGRNEECYGATHKWITDNVKFHHAWGLLMRGYQDNRSDDIVKREIYEKSIKDKYNVLFVLDDRLRCKRLWHSLGLPLLSVGDPDSDY